MGVNGDWLWFAASFKHIQSSLSGCCLVIISCLHQLTNYRVDSFVLCMWLYSICLLTCFSFYYIPVDMNELYHTVNVLVPLVPFVHFLPPLKHNRLHGVVWNWFVKKKKKLLSNVPEDSCIMWASFLYYWHICYLCLQLKELSFAFVFVIEELIALICIHSRNCGWWCALIGIFAFVFSGKSQ